jgi:hypothetical protein
MQQSNFVTVFLCHLSFDARCPKSLELEPWTFPSPPSSILALSTSANGATSYQPAGNAPGNEPEKQIEGLKARSNRLASTASGNDDDLDLVCQKIHSNERSKVKQGASEAHNNMARWMGSDGLRCLTTGKPLGRQLIEIYDAVQSRIPKKVFLARWYPTVADDDQKTRADNRFNTLKRLVETELRLELVDMGTEEGGTYLIHPRMYEAIGSSEIFIADLTGLRANVMIELGYALNHQGTKRLLLMFNSIAGAERVPFDTNSFRYEAIGEAADVGIKANGADSADTGAMANQ